MKLSILLILICLICASCSDKLVKWKDNPPVYPIGENPSIGYKSSMVPGYEHILFEANPILRLPLFNSYIRNFSNAHKAKYRSSDSMKYTRQANAVYISYRPQLRMYTDISKPVRTPSSKISMIGYQHTWNFTDETLDKVSLLSFSFESGHYSNGQDRSAFSEMVMDQTPANDSVYNLITNDTNLSSILNRKSGNFSTNYTELIFDYKWIRELDPWKRHEPMVYWSAKGGINVYHNWLLNLFDIGGYSKSDIKIYGQTRWLFGLDRTQRLKKDNCLNIDRFSVSINGEYINNPHPSVQPWRGELTGNLFFKNNAGIFVSMIAGHDNYNYRFVDSGLQFSMGICFDIFPPMRLY